MPLPPEIYDRDYFLSDRCEGYDYFKTGELSLTRSWEVEYLKVQPGMRVLDAGCGRGEILRICAEAGCQVAGLDYAEAAVEITRETLAWVEGADIRHGDVTDLPWPDASFDRVLLADVIEHLVVEQVDGALAEFLRVLKPGGILLVHTAPNRWFRRFAWPVMRPLAKVAARATAERLDDYLADVLNYHVNEQTPASLPRALKQAGFTDVHGWVGRDVIRSGTHRLTEGLDERRVFKVVSRLSGAPGVRLLLGNDLFASGVRPDRRA